jgi:hypothetical protein
MIQEYLNLQLITTTDDENFDKIKKTYQEVAKKLAKDPQKVLSYSLVAFDPQIQTDNNLIQEVREQVIANWPTFIANAKETSLTVIRAIMLEALENASTNENNSLIIWFALRNVFKYYSLGREKEILTKFLLNLGNNIEQKVSEAWDFSPDYSIDVPKIAHAIVDGTELGNNVNNWAVVADLINKALKKQISDFREGQEEFIHLTSLLQMRTHLLWWREAGYSSSSKKSYRKLEKGALQIVLAKDYSDFVPDQYPISVDYFLAETHNYFNNESDHKIKLIDFLNSVYTDRDQMKSLFDEPGEINTRVTFASFIQGLIHEKFKVEQFKTLVGVNDQTEITLN